MRPDPEDEGNVWVLYRTDGPESVNVIICGTVHTRAEALRWGDSGVRKGAIRVPLGGLARGETWT